MYLIAGFRVITLGERQVQKTNSWLWTSSNSIVSWYLWQSQGLKLQESRFLKDKRYFEFQKAKRLKDLEQRVYTIGNRFEKTAGRWQLVLLEGWVGNAGVVLEEGMSHPSLYHRLAAITLPNTSSTYNVPSIILSASYILIHLPSQQPYEIPFYWWENWDTEGQAMSPKLHSKWQSVCIQAVWL